MRHRHHRQLLRTRPHRPKIDLGIACLVSGIGCTGRVAGYVKLDSFHTTHGRGHSVSPPASKLANPSFNVVVYSGDGDLSAIGGNHLIHAARRNIDLKASAFKQSDLCHDRWPDRAHTPGHSLTSTNPYGPLSRHSICRIWSKPPAQSTLPAGPPSTCANWPAPSAKRFRRKAFRPRSHFALPHALSAPQQAGDGLDTMSTTKKKSKVRHGAPTGEVGLTMTRKKSSWAIRRPRPPRLSNMMRSQYLRIAGRKNSSSKRRWYAANGNSCCRFRRPRCHLSAILLGKAASIYQGAYAP